LLAGDDGVSSVRVEPDPGPRLQLSRGLIIEEEQSPAGLDEDDYTLGILMGGQCLTGLEAEPEGPTIGTDRQLANRRSLGRPLFDEFSRNGHEKLREEKVLLMLAESLE
jgi:hypothetical protein